MPGDLPVRCRPALRTLHEAGRIASPWLEGMLTRTTHGGGFPHTPPGAQIRHPDDIEDAIAEPRPSSQPLRRWQRRCTMANDHDRKFAEHCRAWLTWVSLESDSDVGREKARERARANPDAGSAGYLIASAGSAPAGAQ